MLLVNDLERRHETKNLIIIMKKLACTNATQALRFGINIATYRYLCAQNQCVKVGVTAYNSIHVAIESRAREI